MWFEIVEWKKARMIKNVMKLINFEVKRGAMFDERLVQEDTGTGDTGGVHLGTQEDEDLEPLEK